MAGYKVLNLSDGGVSGSSKSPLHLLSLLTVLAVFLFVSSMAFLPVSAAISTDQSSPDLLVKDSTPIRIGVLAHKGIDTCKKMWQPTMDYLGKALPGRQFDLVALRFEDIEPSVKNKTIDFLICNSAIYVEMEVKYGVTRTMTMRNRVGSQIVSEFGSVIFCRADRDDLNSLQDVRKQRLAAPDHTSFGGWYMALREFKAAGIDPERECTPLVFLNTHPAVVHGVLSGKVDVGIVRTDTIERMARDGEIKMEDIKVIPCGVTSGLQSTFPYLCSTRLYPEWPFAKLSGTDDDISRDLTIALLSVPADSPASIAAHSGGWGVCLDYTSVHECLRELRLPPYQNYGRVSLLELCIEHWKWLLAIIVLIVALIGALGIIHCKRRTLAIINRQSQLVLASAGEGICGMDIRGIITFINPSATKTLGYATDELLGKNFHAIVHGENPDTEYYPSRDCPICSACIDGTIHQGSDEFFHCKNGTTIPISYSSRPIVDNGIISGAVVCFKDITERKQVERTLSKNEKDLSITLNSIGDAVISTDAEGRIVRMNPVAEVLTGWELSEAIGCPVSDILIIINALTREPAPMPVDEVLKTSEVCHLADHTILIARDGTEWQIADSAAPIRDDSGSVVGVVLVFSDMTEQYQIREALRESENRFRKLVDNATFGVAVHDMVFDESGIPVNYVFLQVNPAFEMQTGLSIADIQGKQITDAISGIEDAPFLDIYSRVVLTGEPIVFEHFVESLDRHYNISAYQVGPGRFATVFNDITERKQAEEALQHEKDNLTAIFASSPIGMLLLDDDTMIVNTNAVVANMVSRNLQEILYKRGGGGLGCVHSYENEKGCGYAAICAECSLRHGIEQVLATGIAIHGVEIQATLLINGHEQHPWLRISAEPVLLNAGKHVIVAMDDITERKQAEEELRQVTAEIDNVNRQLEDALQAAHLHTLEVEIAKVQIEMSAAEMEHQARHDALTGLPNRLLFSEELDRIISSHGADDRQCAVLFLDLDKFKMVNDTMGHKAGDALLVQTAARLSSCLRENDILARMGGDEFTILLKDIKSLDDPAVIAQRLLKQVSMPYEINDTKLVIGVSIGGSIFPDNAIDAVGLLKTADAAMYKAKELGRNNCQFFSDEISQESNARVEIENDLRLAMDRDELKVYYQPIIDVNTMKIAGAEALLRWDHPLKGMISPGLFIPVAEETGLIIEIGRMVTDTAFKQCKSWQDMGYTDFELSVNVSPAQLGEIDIISEIHGALADAGLNPSCVKLEVTETVLAKNDNDEVDILSILRSLGLVVCLDDFGIGYSSLSRLNSLPIGHMKIDGYFIKNIAHNRKDRAMTESIIVMAHNLGIKVTAEWIEDEEQMAVIRSLDCDYAQGYLISPAMPPEKFGDFLRNWDNEHNIIDAA